MCLGSLMPKPHATSGGGSLGSMSRAIMHVSMSMSTTRRQKARLGLFASRITHNMRWHNARDATATSSLAHKWWAAVLAGLGSESLATSLPEVAGSPSGFRFGHVSLDVTTPASKPSTPVQRTDKPRYIAGAFPLPSAWVALA